MQFICMVTASYNLGSLMTKNPCLVIRLKHETLKQNFFVFSFMEKILVIQFHSMKKMLTLQFHSWKNAYFAIFMHLCLLYEFV